MILVSPFRRKIKQLDNLLKTTHSFKSHLSSLSSFKWSLLFTMYIHIWASECIKQDCECLSYRGATVGISRLFEEPVGKPGSPSAPLPLN